MKSFDWQQLFIGADGNWSFLLEIVFRTVVMYAVLLTFFKITGKKGIKQLTVFDMILIIALGSAGGDPMFMEDVPILHALMVFVVILIIYLGINRLTQKSHKLDVLLQGETARLVEEGVVDLKKLEGEGMTTLELYSELRQQSVSHLGQVRRAYLEFTGEISIFFYDDDEVKPGLPLFPENLHEAEDVVRHSGTYSCVQCGKTKEYTEPTAACICTECGCEKAVKSLSEKRIA